MGRWAFLVSRNFFSMSHSVQEFFSLLAGIFFELQHFPPSEYDAGYFFRSPVAAGSFYENYFNCTTSNIVYCITCTLCNKLYIGESGR